MSGDIAQQSSCNDKESLQPRPAAAPGDRTMVVMKGNADIGQAASDHPDVCKSDKPDFSTIPQYQPNIKIQQDTYQRQRSEPEIDAEIDPLSDEDNTKGEEETGEISEEKTDKEEVWFQHQEVSQDGENGKSGSQEDDQDDVDNVVHLGGDDNPSIHPQQPVSVQDHHQQTVQQVQDGHLQQVVQDLTSEAFDSPTEVQQPASLSKLQLKKPPKKKKTIIAKVKGKLGKTKERKRKKDTETEPITSPTECEAGVATCDASGEESIAKICFVDDSSDSSSSSSVSSSDNFLRESSGHSRLQPTGNAPRLGKQESSSSKDGQLVTGVASSLGQQSIDDCDGAFAEGEDEEEESDLPKVEAPKLDMSHTLVIRNEAPKIIPNKPSYSPIDNYYDVLIIHSDCKEDWKEVDYIKRIAKKYKWKMISMEEFPAGMTKFQIFSTMLARCTYSMLLLTKQFFRDVWCQHRYAACLTAAIENRQHQWSIIPIIYRDSGYETPLELATIAGLQRKARYFRKNLRSSISSAKRRDREEKVGVYSDPSPPPSPPGSPRLTSPPLSPALEAMPITPTKVDIDTTNMSAGELYRLGKPHLTPSEPIAKFFRDDDRFRKICELLDEEHSLGRDYRLLAQMVGFDAGETRTLAKEKSPTAKILEIFCLKKANKEKLEVLQIFLKMVTVLDQQEVKGLVENEIMVATFN